MADYPDVRPINWEAWDREYARWVRAPKETFWGLMLFFTAIFLGPILALIVALIAMLFIWTVIVAFVLHPIVATVIACVGAVITVRSYKRAKRHVVPFRDDLAVQSAPYIAVTKWVLLFSTLLAAFSCYCLVVEPSRDAQSIVDAWTPKWPK